MDKTDEKQKKNGKEKKTRLRQIEDKRSTVTIIKDVICLLYWHTELSMSSNLSDHTLHWAVTNRLSTYINQSLHQPCFPLLHHHCWWIMFGFFHKYKTKLFLKILGYQQIIVVTLCFVNSVKCCTCLLLVLQTKQDSASHILSSVCPGFAYILFPLDSMTGSEC